MPPEPASPPEPDADPDRHRTGRDRFRAALITCATLCMLAGPVGCYTAADSWVSQEVNGTDPGSPPMTQVCLGLGVLASVVLPIAMAAVAAMRGDRKAAAWSAALLAWPVVACAVVLLGSAS